MVLGQSDAISRGQRMNVRRAIGSEVEWSGQSRLKQAFLAQPAGAAVLSQAFVVQEDQRAAIDPAPGVVHFAS